MTAARPGTLSSVTPQIFLLWGLALFKMSEGEWRFLCFHSYLFIFTEAVGGFPGNVLGAASRYENRNILNVCEGPASQTAACVLQVQRYYRSRRFGWSQYLEGFKKSMGLSPKYCLFK